MHEHINTQTDREFLEYQAHNDQHLKCVVLLWCCYIWLGLWFYELTEWFQPSLKMIGSDSMWKERYWLYKLCSLQKPSLKRANLLYRVCWQKPHPFVVMMMILMIMKLFVCSCEWCVQYWSLLKLGYCIYLSTVSMKIRLHISFRLYQQHLSYIQLD